MEQLLQANPILFLLVGIAGWVTVLTLAARLSGWSALAEFYEAFEAHEGEKRGFQSISMSRFKLIPMNYNGVVSFGTDARGLRMEVFLLFRPGHPALSIPWGELSATASRTFLVERVEIRPSRATNVVISIARPTADWIAAQSGGRFHIADRPPPAQAPATQIATLLQNITTRRG